MPLNIVVNREQQASENVGHFDDLEEALTEFNALINRRDWDQHVTTIALMETAKNQCLAQYALQDFNHSEG